MTHNVLHLRGTGNSELVLPANAVKFETKIINLSKDKSEKSSPN
jgi:hypothetical protein